MADWRSIQSSPSHEPVVQRSFPRPTRKHSGSGGTGGSGSGGGGGGGGRDQKKNVPVKRKPPPRVASTQPRDTSPEPSSSGDDDSGDDTSDADDDADDDEGEWVDEDDSDEDDLLALEYHPTFIRNVEKRRKRFDVRWEALVEAFQALDRQTDATMILLAAPSHTSKMHALTSRSIKRSSSQRSPEVSKLKSNFTSLATSMRSKRPPSSSSSLAFSDASTLNSESDLRRALETALGSLTALGGMWDERETRWKEEMKRAGEERERVEGLLRGVLGERMRD
ncbi:hypothetical protein DL96DRAFT_1472961 [Flagelloscypha sp. PMI_526]|nr:hypothetical protein DL96DRAFT_1472961 [Flagelloscypha sp. PMI_526]